MSSSRILSKSSLNSENFGQIAVAVAPKRFIEIEETLQNCKIERVYVTAFQDLDEFKKHLDSIAWGTEVWIREITNHLIHYNGPTLRGPTK